MASKLDWSSPSFDRKPLSKKSAIAVTKLNPEQSKHLETAITRLFGLELNFVQLRTDVYSESSRIPDIVVSNAYEDAIRRDFTINSLFYNIMNDTIEDWTGNGIKDLQGRIIATPLPPLETLKDDPLRALRAIRFAARFGFVLEKQLSEAIANPVVHALLSSKVAPPRYGIEIRKMLAPFFKSSVIIMPQNELSEHSRPLENGSEKIRLLQNDPILALKLFIESGLHKIVFNPFAWATEQWTPPEWSEEIEKRSIFLAASFHKLYNNFESSPVTKKKITHLSHGSSPFDDIDEEECERVVLNLLSFLYPLVDSQLELAEIKYKHKHHVPMLEFFKSTYQVPLSAVFRASSAISTTRTGVPRVIETLFPQDWNFRVDTICNRLENDNNLKVDLLWIIRRLPYYWKSMILISGLLSSSANPAFLDSTNWITEPAFNLSNGTNELFSSIDDANIIPKDFQSSVFAKEIALIHAIEKLQFRDIALSKPLLNGYDIQELLQLERGPLIGQLLHRLLSWQFVTGMTSVSEAKQFILSLDLKEISKKELRSNYS